MKQPLSMFPTVRWSHARAALSVLAADLGAYPGLASMAELARVRANGRAPTADLEKRARAEAITPATHSGPVGALRVPEDLHALVILRLSGAYWTDVPGPVAPFSTAGRRQSAHNGEGMDVIELIVTSDNRAGLAALAADLGAYPGLPGLAALASARAAGQDAANAELAAAEAVTPATHAGPVAPLRVPGDLQALVVAHLGRPGQLVPM